MANRRTAVTGIKNGEIIFFNKNIFLVVKQIISVFSMGSARPACPVKSDFAFI